MPIEDPPNEIVSESNEILQALSKLAAIENGADKLKDRIAKLHETIDLAEDNFFEIEKRTRTKLVEIEKKVKNLVAVENPKLNSRLANVETKVNESLSAKEDLSATVNEVEEKIFNFVDKKTSDSESIIDTKLTQSAERQKSFEKATKESVLRIKKTVKEFQAGLDGIEKDVETSNADFKEFSEEVNRKRKRDRRNLENNGWKIAGAGLAVVAILATAYFWAISDARAAVKQHRLLIEDVQSLKDSLVARQTASDELIFQESLHNIEKLVSTSPTTLGLSQSTQLVEKTRYLTQLLTQRKFDANRLAEVRLISDATIKFHESVGGLQLEQLFDNSRNISLELNTIFSDPVGPTFTTFSKTQNEQFQDFFVYGHAFSLLLQSQRNNLDLLARAESAFDRVSNANKTLYARSAVNRALSTTYKHEIYLVSKEISKAEKQRSHRLTIRALETSVERAVDSKMKSVAINNLADRWIKYAESELGKVDQHEAFKKAETWLQKAMRLRNCHNVVYVTYAECLASRVASIGVAEHSEQQIEDLTSQIVGLLIKARMNEFRYNAATAEELFIISPSLKILKEMAPHTWEQELTEAIQ